MKDDNSYPVSVFCIIATEFCERFSFSGLRTILSLYLRDELYLKEDTATIVYHVFIMLCYTVPLTGAICADSYLGRYKTILYFSLIYLIGNILMCIAAIPVLDLSPILYTSVGLCLIAVGTGGIKPCVAAFGGDQFHLPRQRLLLQQFSSIFYFTINLGGFAGMVLIPLLRKNVSCFGEDTCYALGFGFPAVLMIIALILFVSGKPWYRMKIPKENMVLNFFRCTFYAIIKKFRRKEKCLKSHWLDYATEKYPAKMIADMKCIYSVLIIFIPLPIFWSLFDQQGSRWTFQASRMDTKILGAQLEPDQMQVINPAIVLILIPLFDKLVFPCLKRLNFLQNPLHRMALGGIIAGIAFVAAGAVELALNKTDPEGPESNQSFLNFINTLPCDLKIHSSNDEHIVIKKGKMVQIKIDDVHVKKTYEIFIETPSECGDVRFESIEFMRKIQTIEKQVQTVLICTDRNDKLIIYSTEAINFEKYISGKPKLRLAYIQDSDKIHNRTVILRNPGLLTDIYFVPDEPPSDLSLSAYMELPVGMYDYSVNSQEGLLLSIQTIYLALGGVYSLILREKAGKVEFYGLFIMSPPNSVKVLWLLPQYIILSVAEIMFGISGLEFSLLQAPKSLKTITLTAWYLSVSMGNAIVIFVAKFKIFTNQAQEFFFFAFLIVIDMIIFVLMAQKYKISKIECESSEIIMKFKQSGSLVHN